MISIGSQISKLKEFIAKEKLVVRQAHHLFEPELQSRRPE